MAETWKVRAARILGLASAPERPRALSRMAAVLILTLAAAAVTHSAAVKAEPAPPARLAKAMAATSSPARVSGIPRESDEALANKAVVLARLATPSALAPITPSPRPMPAPLGSGAEPSLRPRLDLAALADRPANRGRHRHAGRARLPWQGAGTCGPKGRRP